MKLWLAPAGLHIEPAAAEDAEIMARLHAAAFFRGWPSEEFTNYINNPKHTPAYVACDSNRQVCGFLIFRLAADSADLLSIAVDRRRRRKGLGSALLRAGLEDLRLSPVSHIILEVEQTNVGAIHLYRTHGFVEVARRQSYYPKADGSAAAALVMRCDLQ